MALMGTVEALIGRHPLSVNGAGHLKQTLGMQKYHQLIIFFWFYCLVQHRNNGDNCMNTVLYAAVLGCLLLIKEQIIITASSNIGI